MAFGSSSSSMLHSCKRNEEDIEKQEQDIHVAPAPVGPKKRRNPPGIPYPDAEVIALSPTTLMAKNRFVCEVCYKGFPREQNLQLHKRGHNLPWKLKQRSSKDEVKRKVYLCPEPSCIHHNHSHALGDLTGIKKHYSRKHGEKKYKCQKCAKMYAVQSDLKAHSKTCGKKEYQCHCGTLFSRRDSFISHRAFCEALAPDGGLIRHPPTVTSIGANSSKSTQMSASLPEAPSIQNLIHTSPAIIISKGVSQLGQTSESSLMVRSSMGFNCYEPSPAFFVKSSVVQNHHKNQGNFDTRYFTNLTTLPHNHMDNFTGTRRNYGNGEGSSLFSGGGNLSHHSASLNLSSHKTGAVPQLSATALLQKAALLGSTWSSNNSATNYARGNATSFSSGAIDGTKGKFVFGNSDNNGHDNNILNSFNSIGVGSSMFNLNAGATYEQEDSYHGGVDSGSGGYDDEWNTKQHHQSFTNMGFQQSSGVTFTRDFLGVGGEINISNDGPEGTFVGRSFLYRSSP